MTNPHLTLVAPTTVIGTVADRRSPPRRQRNAEVRAREYLTDGEIARLIAAAGKNRYGHRDATMVLVAYRHGLRAGELVTLRWDAIDFAHGRLHVEPAQGQLRVGPSVVRPRVAGAAPAQARASSRLHRSFSRRSAGAPFTPAGFRKMIARLGVAADLRFSGPSAHAAARLRLQARQ